jgi:hypothetical protein
MRRCPVGAWEGWTTKRDLHEDSEWAAAGNCWAAQSYSVARMHCIEMEVVRYGDCGLRAAAPLSIFYLIGKNQ